MGQGCYEFNVAVVPFVIGQKKKTIFCYPAVMNILWLVVSYHFTDTVANNIVYLVYYLMDCKLLMYC